MQIVVQVNDGKKLTGRTVPGVTKRVEQKNPAGDISFMPPAGSFCFSFYFFDVVMEDYRLNALTVLSRSSAMSCCSWDMVETLFTVSDTSSTEFMTEVLSAAVFCEDSAIF